MPAHSCKNPTPCGPLISIHSCCLSDSTAFLVHEIRYYEHRITGEGGRQAKLSDLTQPAVLRAFHCQTAAASRTD